MQLHGEIKKMCQMLMLDLKRAEERAEIEGWIDADDSVIGESLLFI